MYIEFAGKEIAATNIAGKVITNMEIASKEMAGN